MSSYEDLLRKMNKKSGSSSNSSNSSSKSSTNNTSGTSNSTKSGRSDRQSDRQSDKLSDKSDKQVDQPSREKYSATIDREEIDYYKILGIESDADVKQIKRAYHKRLRLYHPDNIKDKSNKDEMRKNTEKYKLINEAYNILGNELRRKAYDTGKKFESSHSKGFESQKNSFVEFIKLQEQNMTDDDKKLAQLKFEMNRKELNAKHGYDESKVDPIAKEEYNRKVEDLMLQREQEELSIQHDNMFEGKSFDPTAFNKAFEKRKLMEAKKGRGKNDGSLVKVGNNDGIMAFNDGMDSGFATIDAYSELYATGNYNGGGDSFAGVGSGLIGPGDNASSDDISIDSEDIPNTYDTHNKGVSKDDMDAMLQRELASRDMQSKEFENMSVKDFGSALDDKFGISKDFGFMVGNDKFGHQIGRRDPKKKADRKTQYEAYKELTTK